MGIEIERRFFVNVPALALYLLNARRERLCQGYLSFNPAVRVRIIESHENARLTIKGEKSKAGTPEYEYVIPGPDGRELLTMCGKHVIDKTRYTFATDFGVLGGLSWEVDEFHGRHNGLWIAEIELDSPDEEFEKPAWLGKEITDDKRYSNAMLALHGLPEPETETRKS